jgi:transitional endoplasmic reticulum ATPase
MGTDLAVPMRSNSKIVTEAFQEDVDRWVARLQPVDMEELNLAAGDVIKVTGKRSTAVRVLPGAMRPDPGYICLDGPTRANAEAGIGQKVTVEKYRPQPARGVVLVLAGWVERHLELFTDPARLRELLQDAPIGTGDVINPRLYGSRSLSLRVIGTSPQDFVVITPETRLEVLPPDASEPTQFRSAYEDIGGLDEQVRKIRETVELPLRYPWLFARLGIQPLKGLLLYGPPGAGKTLIARALASEVKAHFIHVDGPEIMHKYYGESEARLREMFDEAARNAPSIIFLDELDALAPKRSAVAGEVEKRVVAQLLALMDGMVTRGQVVVIGATNMPELLDPALRRTGRFDREIYIGVPDTAGRLEILLIHSRDMPLAEDVDLAVLAEMTSGFVGADLEILCKEAAISAIRRVLPEVQRLGTDSHSLEFQVTVTMDDFREALRAVEPTATRSIAVEKPTCSLAQVAGMETLKDRLLLVLEASLGRGKRGDSRVMRGPRRVLLYGPPGTGKTWLIKALAGEMGLNFVEVVPSYLFSRWMGESERALSDLFRIARQSAPCLVFLDQLDALVPVRGAAQDSYLAGRLVAQLLREMELSEHIEGFVVFAATNRPDLVDRAVRARFEMQLEVPLPDMGERLALLTHFVRELPLEPDVDLQSLAKTTQGMAPGDLLGLCRRAYLEARQGGTGASPPRVGWRHFLRALDLRGGEGDSKELESSEAAAYSVLVAPEQ